MNRRQVELILGDIGSMIFGWLAFQMCRYLLWLAPRTIVVANAHLAVDQSICAITIPNRGATSRSIFVRCYIGSKENS